MRNVPKGSRICVQTQVGRLDSEHCDPHSIVFFRQKRFSHFFSFFPSIFLSFFEKKKDGKTGAKKQQFWRFYFARQKKKIALHLSHQILRPFLMQSDSSVENGLFRLKPKSGFLTQSKKGFFDSTFFD